MRAGAVLSTVLLAGLLAGASGCVQVYQPLAGLHTPAVIDPQAPNFEGMALQVRCLPGELLTDAEAASLCQKVGTLFENQGARVTTDSGFGGLLDDDEVGGEADLILELRARELSSSNDLLLWSLCIASFTVVPAVTETSFAQDVTIRDGGGALLYRESLQGRLVRRFGAGVWAGNAALNLFRDEADKITRDSAAAQLSGDLYLQLSQLTWNARVRREMLQQAAPGAGSAEGAWE